MHRRRFELPPLDLLQAFEAAARTLSFTRAADELRLTQSAVSRQIKALEDDLGVALFERRPRTLALTEEGRLLQRTATDLLERLQETAGFLRSKGAVPRLTVTTTGGFASLWLIPRLRAFTALHPEIDVRISATYRTVDLERSLVDVAVRYCKAEDAPQGAIRLFGEDLFPVCSPHLQARGPNNGPNPLHEPGDLTRHVLLHMDGAMDHMDWDTWLAAHGHAGLVPAAAVRFDTYEQMIEGAVGGHGVAMGIGRLVRRLIAQGRLVAPFGESDVGSRAYFIIRSALSGDRPQVRAFVDWLIEEARAALAAEPQRTRKHRSRAMPRRAMRAPRRAERSAEGQAAGTGGRRGGR